MAFYLFTLLFLLFIHNSCAELIKALPGQPSNVSFNQYSGYIVTDAEHGRALFYYFAEAQSPDHLSLPLTLWLNGGSYSHIFPINKLFFLYVYHKIFNYYMIYKFWLCYISNCNLQVPLCLLGPGCSSIGFGVFMEHGPFQPRENGKLLKNEYSWNLGNIFFF